MKRSAVLGLLVAIALLSIASASKLSAEPPVGVRFDADLFDGVLSVMHAEGHVLTAICSEGFIVFQGVVEHHNFEIMVPHTGPDVGGAFLTVEVKGIVFRIDRDDDWIWE